MARDRKTEITKFYSFAWIIADVDCRMTVHGSPSGVCESFMTYFSNRDKVMLNLRIANIMKRYRGTMFSTTTRRLSLEPIKRPRNTNDPTAIGFGGSPGRLILRITESDIANQTPKPGSNSEDMSKQFRRETITIKEQNIILLISGNS